LHTKHQSNQIKSIQSISYGYIAGTGGIINNIAKSTPYGKPYGAVGDVIRVILDYDQKTVEFFKNGISQGIAFDTLSSPMYAAVSLTACNSSVSLKVWQIDGKYINTNTNNNNNNNTRTSYSPSSSSSSTTSSSSSSSLNQRTKF
jgi:hypothetical protein